MTNLNKLANDLEEATANYNNADTIYNQNYWRDKMESIGKEIDAIIYNGHKIVVNNPNYRD